jgi:hypothetical protein
MFSDNPFADLSTSVPPGIMQAFVVVMIALVACGTLFDMIHKKSARYFFENARKSKVRAKRQVGGGQRISLAIRTLFVEVITAGEFCNLQRRLAHLLTMYGFLAYAISTAVLVFLYPTPDTPAPPVWPFLWHLGALLVCVGGYWFWFFIRVDVAAEGHSPFRVVRADLFILSLLASATFALIWGWAEATGNPWASVLLGLYLIATVALFGSVPWSKFAHMFYKPAAAFQARVDDANGTRSNLPLPADKPETFGSARRAPRNY